MKVNLPGCSSLKEKRKRLQPLLIRLRKEFNAGFSETGLQDVYQSAWVSCAIVSNDGRLIAQVAEEIVGYIERHFPDELIEEHHLEQR